MPPGKTRRLATASSRFAGAQWLPPAGAPARPRAPANARAIDIHSAPTDDPWVEPGDLLVRAFVKEAEEDPSGSGTETTRR